MPSYTILLPPSEGKASAGFASEDGPLSDATSFPSLIDARREVIAALHEALDDLPRDELRKLFGVKTSALDAAIDANANLADTPLLPAIERYTGVLFNALDYPSLDASTQQAFDDHALLFSGLWGILRPTDLIPNYKLKIEAALPVLGKVSTFWEPHISSTLSELVDAQAPIDNQVVWDLLPGAHRRAWDGKAAVRARWRVKFVERKGEKLRTVSHWSKALKGALVQFICERGLTEIDALADFSHPAKYIFQPNVSTVGSDGGELLFVKEM